VSTTHGAFRQHWQEVIGTFLKIGALTYGGAASVGIMQTEVQEKRGWIPKEQYIEGLALVNTLPGPSGIQLGIFLGYTRAGWWGGVLAGLCFILPAFCILLSLTLIYHHYGVLPRTRHLFYGLSPVVMESSPRRSTGWAWWRFAMGHTSCSRSPPPWRSASRLSASSQPCSWLAPWVSCCTARAHGGHRLSAGHSRAVRGSPLGERVVHGFQRSRCRSGGKFPRPWPVGHGALLPQGRCSGCCPTRYRTFPPGHWPWARWQRCCAGASAPCRSCQAGPP
jgi:hypothetical protein